MANHSDSSLFVYHHQQLTLYVLVYVNDIVVTGSCSFVVSTLIHTLCQAFPVKDLGSLSYFLGIEVQHTATGLILSQHKYISDLLTRAGMSSAKPITSPLTTTTHLLATLGAPFDHPTNTAASSVVCNTFRSPVLILPLPLVRYASLCILPVFHIGNRSNAFSDIFITFHYGLHIRSSSSLHLIAFSDAD